MTSQLVLPISTFILGVVLGFVIGWLTQKQLSSRSIENWERALITVVVSMAWAISVILDVALDTYETPVPVHGVMGLVVGYFFEGSVFGKKDK